MYDKGIGSEHLKRELDVCENDKERKIVMRVNNMSEEDWLWWQDIGEQIPFLLFVFIGSTIFRNHWVIKIIIICYLIYGYKVKYDRWYYFEYIYPRIGRNKK